MGKEKVARFFCPFANQMCYEGEVKARKYCKFWNADSTNPEKCELLRGISGLKYLDIVAADLHAIAAARVK